MRPVESSHLPTASRHSHLCPDVALKSALGANTVESHPRLSPTNTCRCFRNRNDRFCYKTRATISRFQPYILEQLTTKESIQTHVRLKHANLGSQIPGSQHPPEGPHGRSKKAPRISQTGLGWAEDWLSQAWSDLSPAERPGQQPRAGAGDSHSVQHQRTRKEHSGREQTLLTICEVRSTWASPFHL